MKPGRWTLVAATLVCLPGIAAAVGDPNDQPDTPLPYHNLVPTPTESATPDPSATQHRPNPNHLPKLGQGLFYRYDFRLQPEFYDFFSPTNVNTPLPSPLKGGNSNLQNRYGFVGFRARGAIGYTGAGDVWDAKLELQNILLGNLPTQSIAPGAAGPLGQGASYYNAARQPWIDTLGVRQLYFRYGGATGALGSPSGTAVKVGRFDYASGMEAPSEDLILDWLKRERISKKVVGQPDYNIFSRSFDGLRFDIDGDPVRFTGFVAHPTQAEPHFATEVGDVLTTNAAITLKQGEWMPRGEGQLFYNHLDDTRSVPQVDSRPAALRSTILAEGGDHIDTYGFDYISHLGADGDLALWGAHQGGRWGHQHQNANAFTAELGLRFPKVDWEPWFRIGYNYYSGDQNPNDQTHGTFLAELADPRVRYNFFSAANLHDAVAQAIIRPSKKLAARFDFHFFTLDNASDLWYSGSGVAQQFGSNGISGRPSRGSKNLGTQAEMYVQQTLDDTTTLRLRLVHAFGGPVVTATYPSQTHGNLIFVEYHVSN